MTTAALCGASASLLPHVSLDNGGGQKTTHSVDHNKVSSEPSSEISKGFSGKSGSPTKGGPPLGPRKGPPSLKSYGVKWGMGVATGCTGVGAAATGAAALATGASFGAVLAGIGSGIVSVVGTIAGGIASLGGASVALTVGTTAAAVIGGVVPVVGFLILGCLVGWAVYRHRKSNQTQSPTQSDAGTRHYLLPNDDRGDKDNDLNNLVNSGPEKSPTLVDVDVTAGAQSADNLQTGQQRPVRNVGDLVAAPEVSRCFGSAAEKAGPVWGAQETTLGPDDLRKGVKTAKRFRVTRNETNVSRREAVTLLQNDKSFREHLIALFRDKAPKYYRFECPPMKSLDDNDNFEVIFYEYPELERWKDRGDPKQFNNQFKRQETNEYTSSDEITAFLNPRKCNLLVCPRPPSNGQDYACYCHIGQFMREAPDDKKHQLLQAVGHAMQKRLEQGHSVCLNSYGATVPWLHVRLDLWPQYTRVKAYKNAFTPQEWSGFQEQYPNPRKNNNKGSIRVSRQSGRRSRSGSRKPGRV